MDRILEKQLQDSRYLKYPLKEDPSQSGRARWAQKPVLASLDLPMTEDSLQLDGPGSISICPKSTGEEPGGVCFELPTTLPEKNAHNRYYAISVLKNAFAPMDLREYNRFSLDVYVDAPDYESFMLQFSLINEGEVVMPTPGRFEGTHHEQFLPGQWKQVIWEIPDLYRDKVTGFTVQVPVAGALPGGADKIQVYLDNMRVEKVEAENSRGFDLRSGSLAYCHSGYPLGARKQALAQHVTETTFTLESEEGDIVFTGPVVQQEKGFALLDFSEFETPGFYTLHLGKLASKSFAVGGDAYLGAAWKILNFFYCERCGFDVPGIHNICHLDVFAKHPDGRTVNMAGGWHDAADVTIGVSGTAQHVVSMLELAAGEKEREPLLYERILEEARWGLNYVMRTRFGDGVRGGGTILGFWSNNVGGDFDDVQANLDDSAETNLLCAAACAYAYDFFKEDRVFSRWLKKCAVEDFDFALKNFVATTRRNMPVTTMAQSALCALKLYDLTGDQKYVDIAADWAKLTLKCQQLEPKEDFALPVYGYFYEDETCSRAVSFFHRSNEHVMSECFIRLLEAAPQHEDAPAWKKSLQASAHYLRTIAKVMPPYGILPAGIYEVDNTDYSNIYHEGNPVGLPTLTEYNAQVRNGIHLAGETYLRRFPVAYQFRGFHVTLMGKAKAAFLLGKYFSDEELYNIGLRQVEYILGFNPFAMSTVYGEGYDYPPLYGGFAGDVVGAVPVGIETFENDDEPYMPMQNNCTYKEIWTHAAGQLMEVIALARAGI